MGLTVYLGKKSRAVGAIQNETHREKIILQNELWANFKKLIFIKLESLKEGERRKAFEETMTKFLKFDKINRLTNIRSISSKQDKHEEFSIKAHQNQIVLKTS
jgi:hypothetical protein